MSRNTKKIKKVFTSRMKVRFSIVFLIIIIMILVLNIKILYINQTKGEEYAIKVLAQQYYSSRVVPFKRGDVLDRNGVALATSVKVYNLILDPVLLYDEGENKYFDEELEILNQCFGYDVEELRQLINENIDRRYIVYEKQLSYEQIEKFVEMQSDKEEYWYLKGIWFETEYKRQYPFSELACHVLGFTASGNVGTWGIEEYYDEYLDGIDGREYGDVNSENILEKVVKEPVDGDTIVSTIDFNLQTIVEKYVAQWKEEYNPENIGVILMNPQNGEILAMSSDITYDLNNPRDLSEYYTEEELKAMSDEETLTALNQMWRNYCISDTFEPGSTFKPCTIAAAIEEGKVKMDQLFVCDGGEEISGSYIKCHKTGGHGEITLQQAIAYSCNDVLMQVAALEGSDIFTDYQSRFGYGSKTGIDLPGEASCAGLLYLPENMKQIDLATNSFGQNFNVTMVQMSAAFSSIINGGNYYEPHVVKEILNSNGGVVEEIGSEIIKKTVTQETSDFIKGGLEMCVESGTGKLAAIDGYTIGGKTGTAQKIPRSADEYILSFIGYAGKEEPELVCYVLVDNAEGDNQATAITTTLFKSIMEEALPYVNIFPDKEIAGKEETTSIEEISTEETSTQEEPINENPNSEEETTTVDDSQGEVAIPYIPDDENDME